MFYCSIQIFYYLVIMLLLCSINAYVFSLWALLIVSLFSMCPSNKNILVFSLSLYSLVQLGL
jgi:hypothetical protein